MNRTTFVFFFLFFFFFGQNCVAGAEGLINFACSRFLFEELCEVRSIAFCFCYC